MKTNHEPPRSLWISAGRSQEKQGEQRMNLRQLVCAFRKRAATGNAPRNGRAGSQDQRNQGAYVKNGDNTDWFLQLFL